MVWGGSLTAPAAGLRRETRRPRLFGLSGAPCALATLPAGGLSPARDSRLPPPVRAEPSTVPRRHRQDWKVWS